MHVARRTFLFEILKMLPYLIRKRLKKKLHLNILFEHERFLLNFVVCEEQRLNMKINFKKVIDFTMHFFVRSRKKKALKNQNYYNSSINEDINSPNKRKN